MPSWPAESSLVETSQLVKLEELRATKAEKARKFDADEAEKVRNFEAAKKEKARAHELVVRKAGGTPGTGRTSSIDVQRNIKFVPEFNEKEVDGFFPLFEKVADRLEWPSKIRTLLLQSVLKGKAQIVYAALDTSQCEDYDVVKREILKAYELVPEAYRRKFRDMSKGDGITTVCRENVKNVGKLDSVADCWSDQKFGQCGKLGLISVACARFSRDNATATGTNNMLLNVVKSMTAVPNVGKSESVIKGKFDIPVDPDFAPFVSKGRVKFGRTNIAEDVIILRDTGAALSLLCSEVVTIPSESFTGDSVLVHGIGGGFESVPLCEIELQCDVIKGVVSIGVTKVVLFVAFL